MCMFHMNFTYVLHARPLRICIRTPSSAPMTEALEAFEIQLDPVFVSGVWMEDGGAASWLWARGRKWVYRGISAVFWKRCYLLNVINNELLRIYPLFINLFIIYLTFINLLTMWSTHGLLPILWGWSCQKGLIAIRNPHCWDDHGRPLIAGALFLTFVAVPMWFAVKACLGHIYICICIYICNELLWVMIMVVWIQRCHWELVWWVVHFRPIAGWVLALRPEVRNGQGLVRMSFLYVVCTSFFLLASTISATQRITLLRVMPTLANYSDKVSGILLAFWHIYWRIWHTVYSDIYI